MKILSKIFGVAADAQTTDRLVFHTSRTCFECGTKLARQTESSSEADWHCPNLDCPVRVRGRIEHWCSPGALDIPLADKALVAQLVNQGLVFDAAELYSLKLKEAAALEGRNEQFAKEFLDQLAVSKTREAWRVLYGLSIPMVDAEVAKELCQHFAALDDILPAGPERIMQQASVADAVARSITHWYGDGMNRRLVRRLRKAGINFKTGPS